MSRTTATPPAAVPAPDGDGKKKPGSNGSPNGSNGSSNGHSSNGQSSNGKSRAATGPGAPANRMPHDTTVKAPEVGASSPPDAAGRPADATTSGVTPGLGGESGTGSNRNNVPVDQLKGRQIGRVLNKMGLVTREQVVEGLTIQKKSAGKAPLGQILIDLSYITEKDLNTALAAQKGIELVDLAGVEITKAMVAAVPAQIATTSKVLPIAFDKAKNTITVAMASQENFRALDDLRSLMGYTVTAKIADADQIDKLIAKHYNAASDSMGDLLGEMSSDESLKDLKNRGESLDLDSLKDAADSNPVKKLINLVLLQAIKDKASDIHFEPFEEEFKMRYRIDGVLYEMMPPPAHIASAISSRIKVMAKLDIAERRVPQDGRIELNVNNQPIDLRVSVLPTMFGESVVMRVLDRSNVSLDLDRIGLRDDDLRTVRQLINKPNGIVVVTGPTGSGKTTTLYSALRELNTPEAKIITAEDPVEYDIDGIIQCQIKPDIELTFGRILRAMLRQDPDTVLIGEIRDRETAEISVQAALTGHLVFSTLHTNDAPSSIARLLDLGLEPFLVTAVLEGVIAQRLVRRICNNCKTEYTPQLEQLMELELKAEDVEGKVFYYGKGCESCNNTGYKGRLGIYEMMVLDDDMRDMIVKHASTQVLRVESKKRGMRTLRESGLMAIYDGITTIEEVVRETIVEE